MRLATRRGLLRALIAALTIGLIAVPLGLRAEDQSPGKSATTSAPAEVKGPLVFAAASLKDALDTINANWKKESGKQAVISYAASSALAKQIEKDAPADIFVSADEDWMIYLAERKLIKPDTRFDLAGNRLVLIAPKDSKLTATIGKDFALASLLGDGRLAMADTASVPAGKYGKAALERLGAWDGVRDKIAQAENVRAALSLVSRGEAPLGIVYATDAKADPKVKVLDTFPESTHAPILYPLAIMAVSTNKDAPAFAAYLKTAEAQGVFEAQGFKVLLNY